VIGVLGCTGAVGRAVAEQLAGWDAGPLRLGGRDPDRVRQVRDGLPAPADVQCVDIANGAELAGFCAGCRVVVNCAGQIGRASCRERV